METILKFVTVLSWIIAPLASLLYIATLALALDYNSDKSITRIKDQLQGVTRVFPTLKLFCAAVCAWAWIIARWLE